MTRTRPTCSAALWLILIALAILGFGLGVNVVFAIPAKAEALYGPASNRISTTQRYLLSYRLVNDQDLLLNPTNPAGDPVEFSIAPDQTVDSILIGLESKGLIPDAEAARNFLVYTGLDTQIQSGDFTLNPALPAIEVLAALLDSRSRDVTLIILAGWRLEEIAASLPTTGLEISAEEFMTAAGKRGYAVGIMQEIPAGVNLEGFFPPGNYQVERALEAEDLVRLLLNEFDALLPYEIKTGIEQQGLSLYQGVILASIVEREAVLEEEMPIIASVFYNRLAIGMLLETDPTVQYAIGYNANQGTWWTNPLSFSDLEYDSPYNTYLYPGLPPTPIANPSLSALQAVAFPAQTPYYYFRAACDDSGRHNFSQTYEEHLANACQSN
jgi:UPF0755 protein